MTQAPPVPTVALPGQVSMPMIGLGTWQLRGRTAYQTVRQALDLGYRHIDTASMYGNEEQVGRALRDSGVPREEVFVTTKLPPGRAGRERATLVASLRALGTGYVDLWLVHWPPASRVLCSVWRECLALRDEGKARAAGVSNYSPGQIDRITDATGQPPAVNQIPWSPARHDPALLEAHRDRGVVLEGYSPLKGTNLSDPVLARIADAHGVTSAQVVLRWHLEHGIVVIPKSAHADRLAANIDILGFSLSAQEIGAVDGLSRHGRAGRGRPG
jgi:2,5-diketo-D-gluconate reductase A